MRHAEFLLQFFPEMEHSASKEFYRLIIEQFASEAIWESNYELIPD